MTGHDDDGLAAVRSLAEEDSRVGHICRVYLAALEDDTADTTQETDR